MKTENFNLIEENWIPVLMKDGNNQLVSLGELYEKSDEIADLSLNPYERVAIMRLLICITMAALNENDLADEMSWRNALSKIKPSVAQYLSKWHNKFNLFGPNAFMQPDDLSVKKESDKSEIVKLFPHFSSGNNGTLYDHGTVISYENIPIGMLVYLNYSAGGQHSKCFWGGVETSSSVSAGPAREKSMLQIYAGGDSLLKTIWLNIITDEMIKTLPQPIKGRPIWELPNLSRSSVENSGAENSVLGRLVPLSRVMKFTKGVTMFPLGEGIKYAPLPIARECMAAVRLKEDHGEQVMTYVSASSNEMPWRNLHAILSMKDKCGSLTLRHVLNMQNDSFSIWCGGLEANKAKDVAAVEWSFADDTSILGADELSVYENGILLAKRVSQEKLYIAAKEYSTAMCLDGVNAILQPMQFKYWDLLEKSQSILLQVAGKEINANEWRLVVNKTAKAALDFACPHQSGRQLEAYVRALKKLSMSLHNN